MSKSPWLPCLACRRAEGGPRGYRGLSLIRRPTRCLPTQAAPNQRCRSCYLCRSGIGVLKKQRAGAINTPVFSPMCVACRRGARTQAASPGHMRHRGRSRRRHPIAVKNGQRNANRRGARPAPSLSRTPATWPCVFIATESGCWRQAGWSDQCIDIPTNGSVITQFLKRSVTKELGLAFPGEIGTQANRQRARSLIVACENLLGPV